MRIIILISALFLLACEPQEIEQKPKLIEPIMMDAVEEKADYKMPLSKAIDHGETLCYLRCVMPDLSVVEIKEATEAQIIEVIDRLKAHHPHMSDHHTCVIKPVGHPYSLEEVELMRSYE